MARIPLLAITILLVCAGGVAVVYVKTRPDPDTQGLPTPVKIDRVAQTASVATAGKSFRFTLSIAFAAQGKSLSLSGKGSYDAPHRLVGMTMRLENAPAGSHLDEPTDVVIDSSKGFVEYLRTPLLAGHLPAGASWVKIDVGKLVKKQGVDIAALQQARSADPSKMLELLRQSSHSVLIGTEEVGGVTTTHYLATVDLERLAAAQPDAAARANLRRTIELSGKTSYPVEVWVDGDGYLRRMRTSEVEPVSGGNGFTSVTATEELSDFGLTPEVAVPTTGVVDIDDVPGFPR